MDSVHLKWVAGTLALAGGIALLLPAAERQIAVMQLRANFPGLVPIAAKGPRPWFVKIEHVKREPGWIKVVVSIKNGSAQETIRSASVQCVAFDFDGKPTIIGNGLITNLQAGGTGYEEVLMQLPAEDSHGRLKCSGNNADWG